jgi:hypothetical protein
MPWVSTIDYQAIQQAKWKGQYSGNPSNYTIRVWVPDNVTITKYKAPVDPISIIGIVAGSATLTHLAYDNATGLPAQLTQTIFDTTTRGDSARILLTNATGSEKVVRGATIRAKAITKLSGTEGLIHDKFVDYESIANNGEQKMEIGNDFIVTFDQVNKLADYHWKNNSMDAAATLRKAKRHIYTIAMPGMQTFFEMGEWYTLAIGTPGTAESISSVVECYSIRCSLTFEDIGQTSIAFREMYQNWVFDSNEVARSIASGQFNRTPGNPGVTVAPSTYPGTADYYCDGTADDVEINAALKYSKAKGVAGVTLLDGLFETAATITIENDGITLKANNGAATIRAGGGGYYILTVNTSPVGPPAGVTIEGIRFDAVRTGGTGSINISSSPAVSIINCNFTYWYGYAINGASATNTKVLGCYLDADSFGDANNYGIVVGDNSIVSNNHIKNAESPFIMEGIRVAGNDCVINSNSIFFLISDDGGSETSGIYVTGDRAIISGNKIIGVDNFDISAKAKAIHIASTAANTSVSNNYCYNNGPDTGIANTNGCNYFDEGTDTQLG